MVVNLDIAKKEDLQKIISSYRDYIMLDVKEFQYYEDKEKFKNAIEVLDVINAVHWANQFYQDVNSKVRIPTKILHNCIDAGFSNQPFNKEELTQYFDAIVMIEEFSKLMMQFKLLENYTPYDLEFVLFGLSYEEQNHLSEKDREKLHDAYGDLYCNVRFKNIDVKTFIKRVEILINDFKKNAVENCNKIDV